MADKEENLAIELLHSINMLRKVSHNLAHEPGKHLKRNEQMIIMYLRKHSGQGDLKISDLGKLLELAPSTISPIIHSLETNGFIERYHNQDDRRVAYIRLSKYGFEQAEKVRKNFRETLQGLADYLGQEDTEKLVEILRKTYKYATKVQQERKEDTK
ncbi:MarR family winged helix-turn-helix transcriptional regulator [Culicoidibacter larvae]|nr:MarR family transcriptional regulator [Culicoidibacter larvae]